MSPPRTWKQNLGKLYMGSDAAYQREYWKKHPEHRLEDAVRKKTNMRLHQARLADYLRAHPCVDCGEKDIVVLEFDHRPGTKKVRDISGMSQAGPETLAQEMEKCEVRCANCHTRVTAQRANTLRWQFSQL
jgi:hypothetical protein